MMKLPNIARTCKILEYTQNANPTIINFIRASLYYHGACDLNACAGTKNRLRTPQLPMQASLLGYDEAARRIQNHLLVLDEISLSERVQPIIVKPNSAMFLLLFTT